MDIEIRTLSTHPSNITLLAGLLIEATANGASISFMHPLSQCEAEAFWRDALTEAHNGHQFIFGAFRNSQLIGTVTLCPVKKENQPHRAEIAKLIVAMSQRRQGIAKMLMDATEDKALELGRTLLVLDTTTGSAAAKLYEKMGWAPVGIIPDHALLPNGRLSDTTVYWKKLRDHTPSWKSRSLPA